MKKLFTLFCALFLAFLSNAQTNVASVQDKKTAVEVVALKETEYDFGKIPQGKPVTHIFNFTNTGAVPLKLDNVQASCGCTTPEWSKDEVAPGSSSKITVGYNAANDGEFEKTITLTYNGSQTQQIIIKGEVWKTPVASAPENSALNSLKN